MRTETSPAPIPAEPAAENRLPSVEALPTRGAAVPRAGFVAALLGGFVALTMLADDVLLKDLQRVFIFAIAAVSINLLMGYAGQISLGHQAFFGVGALTSAGLVSTKAWPFGAAVLAATLLGSAVAALLGLVALRLRGLYLALITLAFGFFTENVIFNIRALTRGAAGMPAPRPSGFASERAYLYLCIGFFAVVQLVDWWLVSTKGGRAIRAVRENERVSYALGVDVMMYKVLAFVVAGAFAGLAGALFAHQTLLVSATDFNFQLALTFVFMAVVGGLGSRAGVFVAAAFFTLFPSLVQSVWPSGPVYVPLIGAVLLVATLIFHPGGIAEQLRPLTRWVMGK